MELQNVSIMIAVITTEIVIVGKFYTVTLGNGANYSFTSLKKAKAFNVGVSRFLTKKVLILNEVLSELQVIHRKQWAICENRQHKGKNLYLLYREIRGYIDSVVDWFDWLTSCRCRSGVYAFICIEKVIKVLEQIFNLFDKAFSASSPVFVQSSIEKLRYINRQCYKQVRQYGIEDCTDIVSILETPDMDFSTSFLKVG